MAGAEVFYITLILGNYMEDLHYYETLTNRPSIHGCACPQVASGCGARRSWRWFSLRPGRQGNLKEFHPPNTKDKEQTTNFTYFEQLVLFLAYNVLRQASDDLETFERVLCGDLILCIGFR